MSQSQQDILSTQSGTKNPISSNSSPLIEREQIEGSPFWIIGEKETGYFLTFSKWKLSENQTTKLDVILHLESHKWEIILKMIMCINQDLHIK